MLNRDDMLELTRRMTAARSCFDRIAGSYRDDEGYDYGSFNINFLKLSPSERTRNLNIAKTVIFSKTNEELVETRISMQFRQLFMGLNACGLKNDALLDTFYEVMAERIKMNGNYAIYVFHGSYDVPVKGKDKEWLEGSEEVYSFLICAVCPVSGEYEPGMPLSGFLYPSFKDRSSDTEHIAVFSTVTK